VPKVRVRRLPVVASLLTVGVGGGFVSGGDLRVQGPITTASDRRTLSVPMVRPDQTDAGFLVVVELGLGRALIRTDALGETGFVLFRPGVCYAKLPPPNRSVHPYFGSDGELPVGFDELQGSTFAVEIVGKDGRTLACGQHAGSASLRANSWGVRPTGRARWRGRALYFSGGGVSVTVAPSSSGRQTLVTAKTDAGGSNGVFAHLRTGSCRTVARGREWPMLLSPEAAEAGTAHGSVLLAIAFARIRQEPFAFEVHDDVIGVKVVHCVDLFTQVREHRSPSAS
jgi:hypothetical protein